MDRECDIWRDATSDHGRSIYVSHVASGLQYEMPHNFRGNRCRRQGLDEVIECYPLGS